VADGQRAKVFLHPIVLTEHVFDKVRSIDMTLAEFNTLLTAHGVIIEEAALGTGQVKELVLYVDWTRPLHVVVHVDETRGEERIVTVYEPDTVRWTQDFRRRRS
jgi:hypothetical protein